MHARMHITDTWTCSLHTFFLLFICCRWKLKWLEKPGLGFKYSKASATHGTYVSVLLFSYQSNNRAKCRPGTIYPTDRLYVIYVPKATVESGWPHPDVMFVLWVSSSLTRLLFLTLFCAIFTNHFRVFVCWCLWQL